MLFRNRREAGRDLATHLMAYADRTDVLVLALPRGGVPVAFEVAQALHAPLDVAHQRQAAAAGAGEVGIDRHPQVAQAVASIASRIDPVVAQAPLIAPGADGVRVNAEQSRRFRHRQRGIDRTNWQDGRHDTHGGNVKSIPERLGKLTLLANRSKVLTTFGSALGCEPRRSPHPVRGGRTQCSRGSHARSDGKGSKESRRLIRPP